jgi:hypothetical protein
MLEVKERCNDGKIWKCTKTMNGQRHFRAVSIRSNSVFEASHLDIRTILFLLYEWAVRTPVGQAAYELAINKTYARRTYRKFRRITNWKINIFRNLLIGGPGEIIEVDECQIGRRKHNRGRRNREVWVLGAISRLSTPSDIFIEIVTKRSAKVLIPVIKRSINPASRLISDDWGAYRRLNKHGFNHSIVRHCDNFVDPNDPSIHTQNIENTWKYLRKFLNHSGNYIREHLNEYIQEFVFRKRCADVFECMISLIEEKYIIN